MTTASWLRLTAVAVVCVLALTLGAPARAEAVDAFTALAIAGAAVVVVILIVYLVVANVKGDKMRVEPAPVMVACAEADGMSRACWPVASVAEAAAAVPGAAVRVVTVPVRPEAVEQAP